MTRGILDCAVFMLDACPFAFFPCHPNARLARLILAAAAASTTSLTKLLLPLPLPPLTTTPCTTIRSDRGRRRYGASHHQPPLRLFLHCFVTLCLARNRAKWLFSYESKNSRKLQQPPLLITQNSHDVTGSLSQINSHIIPKESALNPKPKLIRISAQHPTCKKATHHEAFVARPPQGSLSLQSNPYSLSFNNFNPLLSPTSHTASLVPRVCAQASDQIDQLGPLSIPGVEWTTNHAIHMTYPPHLDFDFHSTTPLTPKTSPLPLPPLPPSHHSPSSSHTDRPLLHHFLPPRQSYSSPSLLSSTLYHTILQGSEQRPSPDTFGTIWR